MLGLLGIEGLHRVTLSPALLAASAVGTRLGELEDEEDRRREAGYLGPLAGSGSS